MRKERIMDRIEPLTSVEEVIALARYGAKVQVKITPRLYTGKKMVQRKNASFRLTAAYSVIIGSKTSRFEKTYAKGHEISPLNAAANGFVIANTRLHRDVKKLRLSGVKCEVVPFILTELLPGTDISKFEPRKPFFLDQFGILAGIGIPVNISMTTDTRQTTDEKGKTVYELYAVYSIHCLGKEFLVETRHGRFAEGAGDKIINRVLEVAIYRLELEQRKLRRVGVEISMGQPWAKGTDLKRSPALVEEAKGKRQSADENTRPLLQALQG